MTPIDREQRRVLVTGSAGCVGRVVCAALRRAGHDVRGFDLQPGSEVFPTAVGSITDPAALDTALGDRDALVHLAAMPWAKADFPTQLLDPNVLGLYHVMDAARRHELRRVVLASTIQTVGRLLRESTGRRITPEDTAPRNHYALTKVWAEQMGRMYAEKYELSVVAARIGWFPRDPEGLAGLMGYPHGRTQYISHDDAGRFFVAAVEADHPGYGSYWVLGPESAERFDLEPGRRVLGYAPQDVCPRGLTFPVPDDAGAQHPAGARDA